MEYLINYDQYGYVIDSTLLQNVSDIDEYCVKLHNTTLAGKDYIKGTWETKIFPNEKSLDDFIEKHNENRAFHLGG